MKNKTMSELLAEYEAEEKTLRQYIADCKKSGKVFTDAEYYNMVYYRENLHHAIKSIRRYLAPVDTVKYTNELTLKQRASE